MQRVAGEPRAVSQVPENTAVNAPPLEPEAHRSSGDPTPERAARRVTRGDVFSP